MPNENVSFSHQLEYQKKTELIAQPTITNGSNNDEKVYRMELIETPVMISIGIMIEGDNCAFYRQQC